MTNKHNYPIFTSWDILKIYCSKISTHLFGASVRKLSTITSSFSQMDIIAYTIFQAPLLSRSHRVFWYTLCRRRRRDASNISALAWRLICACTAKNSHLNLWPLCRRSCLAVCVVDSIVSGSASRRNKKKKNADGLPNGWRFFVCVFLWFVYTQKEHLEAPEIAAISERLAGHNARLLFLMMNQSYQSIWFSVVRLAHLN